MAALPQCLRHLQALQPSCFAPSTSKPSPATRQRSLVRRHTIAAVARRGRGDTLQAQLSDLLPDAAENQQAVSLQQQQPNRTRQQQAAQRKAKRQPQQQEEDVEIFSIESGWSDAAFAADDGSSDAMEWTTSNYDPNIWDDEEDEGDDDIDGALSFSTGADLADEDSEDDEGWSVSALPDDFRIERASQGSAAMREPEVGSALQELLDSMPQHLRRKLQQQELEAAAEDEATDPKELRKADARRKTHRRLRIISGSAGGKRILSPQGDVTRPMMEMVRAAVFSMIMARIGGSRFPEGSRWLDLFAGTGSVGLEALSRGVEQGTFVELDPWVLRSCLQPNVETCGLEESASVFNMKAEEFLARAAKAQSYGGGAYDFISVCPPYLLVSYPELIQLLEASGLAKPSSIILVEYPKRLAHEIPDTLCGLPKVRDRKYGRTFLALYAPQDADEEYEHGASVWDA